MIEMYMYFVMGFLVAALGGLVVLPLVHARAVGLTERRLEGVIPSSTAEILADKDLLRAKFALSTRRLEAKLDELNARSANERAELGRKSDAINRLTIELTALHARLNFFEETSASQSSLYEPEGPSPDGNADPARMPSTHDVTASAANLQEDEAAALRMQVQALQGWLALAGAEIRALNAQQIEFASTRRTLAEERCKFENFRRRVAELVQQLLKQGAEDKMVNARVRDLESRLTRQSQLLNQRETDLMRLQHELNTACNAEADLRSAVIEIDGRANAATAEKRKLQASLNRANGERVRLAYELADMKRKFERTEQTGQQYAAAGVDVRRSAEILAADLELTKPAA